MKFFSKKEGKKGTKAVSLSLPFKSKNIAFLQASTYRNIFLHKTWLFEVVLLLIAGIVSGTIIVQFFFLWNSETVETPEPEERLAQPLIEELSLFIANRRTTFESTPTIPTRVFPTPPPAAIEPR